jgi:hypothetical protein
MTKRNFPTRTRIEIFWLDAISQAGSFEEKDFAKLREEGDVSTLAYTHHSTDEGIYLATDWSQGEEPYGDIKFLPWGMIKRIVVWKQGGKR